MASSPPSEPRPFSLVLDAALGDGGHRKRVPAPLVIADARAVAQRALSESMALWRFEAATRQPDNLANPNQLSYFNWAAAALLVPDGQEWAEVASAFTAPLPPLSAIPPTADLLTAPAAHREAARQALVLLTEQHGLEPPAATRLLYQKRPGMFPIGDRCYRLALGIRLRQPDRGELFSQLLNRTVDTAGQAQNRAALARLSAWLAERPSVSHYFAFTPLRLFNIVAAAALEAREAEEPAEGDLADE